MARASLSLTRYDEKATNLIQRVYIDQTATPIVQQYQNIGVVEMQGWEVEGSVRVGPVTLEANYAYSDNVVREVTEATAANPNATLKVGDRTENVPKHSAGGRVTARLGRGSVSVDGSVMKGWRQVDYIAYYGSPYAGEPYRGSLREYYIEYPALWKWNLRAEQAVTERAAQPRFKAEAATSYWIDSFRSTGAIWRFTPPRKAYSSWAPMTRRKSGCTSSGPHRW